MSNLECHSVSTWLPICSIDYNHDYSIVMIPILKTHIAVKMTVHGLLFAI